METSVYVFNTFANDTDDPFAAALGVYSMTMDIIGTFGFICLLIYKCKKKREGNSAAKDYHGPILNQFFYISTIIIIIQLFTRIVSISGFDSGILNFLLFLTASTLVYFYPTVISVILMFCFLAAFQKMIILYQSSYKTWVTGMYLKWSIGLIWMANLHYVYLRFDEVFEDPASDKCSSDDKQLIYIYQGAFLTCNFSSIFIYYKIYKLLARFTRRDDYHKIHFLWQFLPIHIFLTVHTIVAIWCRVDDWVNSDCETFGIDTLFAMLLFPSIPALVSMSYIASRHAVRMTIISVLEPFWRAMREASSG